MPLWFSISIVLMLIGIVAWFIPPIGPNLGIDFKGGSQFSYRLPGAIKPKAGEEVKLLDETRNMLEKAGFQNIRLQIAGGDTLVVNTAASDISEMRSHEKRVTAALNEGLSAKDASIKAKPITAEGQQMVGAVIGKELRNNAIWGVILGVGLIALWIFIRYNFAGEGVRYAVAGITALLHDVIVLLGIFALIGKIDNRIEVDGAFIAALLTVVGYSINDSVVIFDRIRENLRNRTKEPYEKVINDSLLETMSRSINTGTTVLIMLFTLLLFGGESIYNFVLAMLIGIVSGLYSSIFNASMVLVAWHRWEEKKLDAERASRTAAMPRRATPAAVESTPRPQTPRPSVSPAPTPRAVEAPRVSETPRAVDTSSSSSGSSLTPPPADSSRPKVEPPRKARAKRRF